MPKFKLSLLVHMDEMTFNNDSKIALYTEGVTTCIAFVIRGTYWDDDEDQKKFCGLFHWSGFDSSTQDPIMEVNKTLHFFFRELRTQLSIDDDSDITIEQFVFIGGEHPEYNSENELMLSGTEKEVSALMSAVAQFDFIKYHLKVNRKAIEHVHYLTSMEQTLTINVNLDSYQYTLVDGLEEAWNSNPRVVM